jgi:phenylacetate-CoA ligase
MSTLNTTAFFIKQRALRPRAYSRYRQLLENERLSGAELRALNWRKRARLLEYAYTNVPFYRRRLDAMHIHPRDIRTPEDWIQLPLLHKTDLVQSHSELLATGVNPGRLALSTTGGSTGKPVKVYHDRQFPHETLGWRMFRWWNIQPGIDSAIVLRLPGRSPLMDLTNRVMWWPTRRIFLDASSMTPERIDQFLASVNKCRPALVQGYVGAVHALAERILGAGLRIHAPEAVTVTAAPLSSVQRALIERAFHAPVYDQYGCGEVFWLGAECDRRAGLHVFADSRHLEIVDESGRPCEPGMPGKVIVTDLENYVFPLIRYEVGDRSSFEGEPCPCGRPFPLIQPVRGRISDVLHFPDGRIISGEYLTTLFDSFPDAVTAFQVHQGSDASIAVRAVPNRSFAGLDATLESVRRTLQAKAGHSVPVRISLVPHISSDRGKTRYVISDYHRHVS